MSDLLVVTDQCICLYAILLIATCGDNCLSSDWRSSRDGFDIEVQREGERSEANVRTIQQLKSHPRHWDLVGETIELTPIGLFRIDTRDGAERYLPESLISEREIPGISRNCSFLRDTRDGAERYLSREC